MLLSAPPREAGALQACATLCGSSAAVERAWRLHVLPQSFWYSEKNETEQVQNTMYLSLGQAAKETGKSKSVISNALKSGRLSGQRNNKGEWEIDPAELFRVFSPLNRQQNGSEQFSTQENPLVELLREQLRLALNQIQQGHERERQGTEEKMRLLAMLENEQQSRRELEQRLLPAPSRPAQARKGWLWILLVLLVLALVGLVVSLVHPRLAGWLIQLFPIN